MAEKKEEKQPRRFITLCERLYKKAKKIGDDNASKGIRKALESYKK